MTPFLMRLVACGSEPEGPPQRRQHHTLDFENAWNRPVPGRYTFTAITVYPDWALARTVHAVG